jgi:hypothetical protein
MNDRPLEFLAHVSSLSPRLTQTYQDTLEYWAPDPPPFTVAYADIGRSIVDTFDTLEPSARKEIFSLIEEGMRSDDEALGVAVATGLIEGLAGRASRSGKWPHVRSELGPLCRSHADTWLQS